MIMTIKEIVLTPDLANYCTVAAALKVIDDYMTGQFDNEAGTPRRWSNSDAIAALPLEKVRRAVELAESGQTPFVPKRVVTVAAAPEFGAESSMMEWDSHGLHT